jgi:hypothetical protein
VTLGTTIPTTTPPIMMLLKRLFWLLLIVPPVTPLVVPAWDFPFPLATQYCVAGDPKSSDNSRWVFVATPAGVPPRGGWPVYFSFVTDRYPSFVNGSNCGPPPSSAWGSIKKCECRGFVVLVCKTAAVEAEAGGGLCYGRHVPPPPLCSDSAFSTPAEALAPCPCFANNNCSTLSDVRAQTHKSVGGPGSWAPSIASFKHYDCDYDSLAGVLWDQRIKQYMVANGVAVVQANPILDDSWDAYDDDANHTWSTGQDQPFLRSLFTTLSGGGLGDLNSNRLIFRGWSGGAQMVCTTPYHPMHPCACYVLSGRPIAYHLRTRSHG